MTHANAAQGKQPWLAALREQLEDGRTLFRESYEVKQTEYDTNGVLARALRLTEAKADSGIAGTVEVTVAQADIINRNRRLYSKKVYELAVGRAQTLVSDGTFLGECDHPYIGTLEGAAVIWTKVWMEGTFVRANGNLLKTGKGQHVKALLDGKVGVKVSTRGYASYTEETRELDGVPVDIAIIGDDYTMEGIDFVLFQSNPAGRVDSHESTTHIPEVKVKLTLAQLRTEQPDLVAQIEAAAREGFIATADVDKKVLAAQEAARVEGVEAGKKAALESAPVKEAVAIQAAVASILKPAAPAPVTESEKVAAQLAEQVATLTSQLKTQEAAAKVAEKASQDAATAKAVSEKVDEVTKGFAHADLVKADLQKCTTVEQVTQVFGEKKALIEQTIARAAVGAASGGAPADLKSGDGKTTLTESQQADLKDVNYTRAVSGMPLMTAEKYLESQAAQK